MKPVFGPKEKSSKRNYRKPRVRADRSAKLARAIRPAVEELELRQMLSVGQAPVAVLHGPYNVNEGESIIVSGGDSTDADGTIVSYKWDFNYDPENGFVTQDTGNPVAFQADDGPSSQIIALRVTDDDGNTDTTTATINTVNVAPTIELSGADTVAEAGNYTINFSATDPANDTISGWEIDWGDGTAHSNVDGNTTSADHVFNDHGTPTITVTATDEDGSYSATKQIEVTPVVPDVSISGDPTINEGSSYRIDFSSSDSGGDTRSGWVIDWGDGTVIATGASATTRVHTYTDNGDYTIKVTALASDGDEGSNTLGVTVLNVLPTVSITNAPAGSSPEGTAITVGSTATDPGNDTLTRTWSVIKDEGAYELPDGTDTSGDDFTFTPRDNGSYVIRLAVFDGTDTTTVDTDPFTVTNVDPTGSISGAPTDPINEGDTVSLSVDAHDAGADDLLSYSWSVTRGEGETFTLPEGTSTTSSDFSFVPTDDGSYVASVVITDDDSGSVTVSTAAIVANNVDPTGNITGEPINPTFEGDSVTLGAHPQDAGSEDTFTYAWTLKRNGSLYSLPEGTDTESPAFTFTPRDNGTYVAYCVITDDDGGQITKHSADVIVDNANPTGTIQGPEDPNVLEGSPVNLHVSASDPGAADVLSYSWSVTKNSQPFDLPGDTNTSSADFTFAPDDQGDYDASVTITDGDGGSATVHTTFTALNAAPAGEITGQPEAPVEGVAITLTANASDAGNDELTYAWSVTKDEHEFLLPEGTDTSSSEFTFTPTDNGDYVATCTVSDGQADTPLSSGVMQVANVNPLVEIISQPEADVNEGTPITLTASPTDVSADSEFTYSWSVTRGEGETFALPEGTNTTSSEFTFTPTDNGSYVVSVTVTDKDNGQGTASTDPISVVNVNPAGTVTFNGDLEGDHYEGQDLGFTANATDAGAEDTFSYSWSVSQFVDDGEGGFVEHQVVEPVAGDDGFTFTPTDQGTYIVRCTVTDDDNGQTTLASDSFTVLNASPIGEIQGMPEVSTPEGTPLTLTMNASDPGSADTLTYAWSVTKGETTVVLPDGTDTTSTEFTFTPTDDGEYTVHCVVTDNDGAPADIASNLLVTNVDPTATITGEPEGDIAEGTPITLTAHGADAGADDVSSLSYSWSVTKDEHEYLLPEDVDVTSSELTFIPSDNGEYVATVTVTDKDNGTNDVASNTINVVNANPTGEISGQPDGSLNEGDTVNLSVSANDAGADDVEGLTYSWSVKQGEEDLVLPEGTNTTSSDFSFIVPDQGTYTATVRITDKDTGFVDVSTDPITVNNVNPEATVTGAPEAAITEGDSVTLTANVTDAGLNDTFTYAWQVQLLTQGAPLDVMLPEGVDTTSQSLTFHVPDDGTYVATVTVHDNTDGVTTASSDDIVVDNANPTGTISGQPDGNINEGDTVNLSVTPADAGVNDTFTYSWSVKKGEDDLVLPEGADTTSADFSFVVPDDGSYVAKVTITDKDGGTVDVSTDPIIANNVTPSATFTGVPEEPVAEGTQLTVTAHVTDPGVNDTFTYDWHYYKNDGENMVETAMPADAAIDGNTVTFTASDNGLYGWYVYVSDNATATSLNQSALFTVTNVAPTGTISGKPDGDTNEGAPITLTANPHDAGSLDTFGYSWSVTRGEGEAFALPDGTDTTSQDFTFTPTDDGSYVATCRITDKDGDFVDVSTGGMNVVNVDPTATISGGPEGNGLEGTPMTFTANPSDAGSEDTFTYAWSIQKDEEDYFPGEGVATDGASFTFTPSDNGDYVVTCVVTDDNGGSTTASTDIITVDNADPSVSITRTPEASVAEGTEVGLLANVTDAGSQDTFSYMWSVKKDDADYTLGHAVATDGQEFIFAPEDNGDYVVSVTVTDNNGGEATTSTSFSVSNANPTGEISGAPEGSIVEGTPVSLTVTAADAGARDTFTYSWSVKKDDAPFTLPEGTITSGTTFNLTPADNGSYVFTCTITDDDSGHVDVSSTITVTNADPAGTVSGAPEGSITEGTAVNLTAHPSDVGVLDTFTYSWSVKKDTVAYTLPNGTSTTAADFTFTPRDNGSYVATVTITDKDGGHVDVSTSAITATNVAPTATLTGEPSSSPSEGSLITLNVAATDAGADDVLTYAWTVTKDGNAYTLPGGVVTTGAAFAFTPSNQGSYIATCVISDDDSGSITKHSNAITVLNAAPTAIVSTSAITVRGRTMTVNATISDYGALDTESIIWNWGDGSQPETLGVNAGAVLHREHIYATAGNYTVTVTGHDNDGAIMTGGTTLVTSKIAAILPDPMDANKTALVVGGSPNYDTEKFTLTSNGNIKLTMNGVMIGTYAPTGHIIAYGDAGNNQIYVDKAITMPAVLYGASGKDTLSGGSGNDVIIGRKGNDALYGNGGRDLLIGGVGSDLLMGGLEEDILIGGTSTSMENFNQLAQIQSEWSRTDVNNANRIKHLRGILAGGLNTDVKLNSGWVFEEAGYDSLYGNEARDWVFTDPVAGNDKALDFLAGVDTQTSVGESAT